jgi:hypothetical protein
MWCLKIFLGVELMIYRHNRLAVLSFYTHMHFMYIYVYIHTNTHICNLKIKLG